MSERTCRFCRYRVLSAVVTECPNCGRPLPAAAASHTITTVLTFAVLIGIAGAVIWFMKVGVHQLAPATTVPARPLPVARPSPAARTTPAPAASAPALSPGLDAAARAEAARLRARLSNPAAEDRDEAVTRLGELRDPNAVALLVGLLGDENLGWHAAQALGRIGTPEAERVLMDAYARRDHAVMSGAHAFYLERRAPQFEPVLVELLRAENDLAIAQTLILSKNPRLVGPAQAWAAEKGWALVPSAGSPGGVTWTEVAPEAVTRRR